VRLEGKTLMPTPQGQQLIAAMPVESLKSAQLTGEWEARLSQMARGEFTRDVFMAQVQAFARDAVARILGQEIDGGSAPTVLTPTPVIEPVKSRRRPKKPAAKPAATSQAAAPRARRAAKGAAKLGAKATTGRPTAPKTSPAAGQADGPLGMACPVCRSPVARTGRVYACAQARNCTFVIFTQVAQRLITPETVLALLTHGETPELTGFINRNGEPFAARLVLSREGRVNFAF
jgi:DNA topoisomerase-3